MHKMKKKRKRSKFRVVQKHHISYEPENTSIVYKSEHRDVTIKNRMNKQMVKTSEYYLKCLIEWSEKRLEKYNTYVHSSLDMNLLYVKQEERKMQRIKNKKSSKEKQK